MAHGINLQIAAQQGASGPKWLDAYLASGQSIPITMNSQIWNAKAGSFSETISLPIEENLHILGNLDSMRGCDVYKLLYGRKFRLYAEDILIFYGVIHMDNEVAIKDNAIEIELASSTLEWEDMIEDLECRDVPLKDEVVLGDAIDIEEKATLLVDYMMTFLFFTGAQGGTSRRWKKNMEPLDKVTLPSILIPRNLNTNIPYPGKPYCNINICWQKEDKDGNKLREYEVGGYYRENSSPCFYVLYFFDCLFKHLGISVLRNDLMDYEDLRRLAFVNTACFYDIDKNYISPEQIDVGLYVEAAISSQPDINENEVMSENGQVGVRVSIDDVRIKPQSVNLYKAVATSKNFPDKDVKSVVSSILEGFGARLLYDSTSKTCSIVLLRNIICQQDYAVIECEINDVYQEQIHKDGFRMKYSATQDDKDVDMDDTSRDTMFNYTEYQDVKHRRYNDIYKTPKLYDNTCYIDDRTGKAYRIKVDKDAKNKRELYPTWFEVGQFCKYEYGDCSNDDYVEEVSIGFSPVVMNVVSTKSFERYAYLIDSGNVSKRSSSIEDFAFDKIETTVNGVPYTETRRDFPEDVSYEWTFGVSLTYKGGAAYSPTENAQNPLNEIDNGLQLGFCRGNTIPLMLSADDEGNLIYPTHGTNIDNIFHEDSVDNLGHVFDYNGILVPGVDYVYHGNVQAPSDLSRLSLRIRAEKPLMAGLPKTIETKKQAGVAMKRLFASTNIDLTSRRKIDNGRLAIKNWNVPNDGYSTAYGVTIPVTYGGASHDILWTPIKEDGTVITEAQLRSYINLMDLGNKEIKDYTDVLGYDTQHLILDIDTTEYRVALLQGLQDIYYAGVGDTVTPVDLSGLPAYQQILEPRSQRRGLFDRFYAEYAFYVTHCRLAVISATVELAVLVNIDMSKKYKIGEYIGLLKSVKYKIDDNGLGDVTFELYYLAE